MYQSINRGQEDNNHCCSVGEAKIVRKFVTEHLRGGEGSREGTCAHGEDSVSYRDLCDLPADTFSDSSCFEPKPSLCLNDPNDSHGL